MLLMVNNKIMFRTRTGSVAHYICRGLSDHRIYFVLSPQFRTQCILEYAHQQMICLLKVSQTEPAKVHNT